MIPTTLQCSIHKKEMEQLTHICLEPLCQQNLLCPMCLDNHKGHEVVNFRRFFSYTEEMLYDQSIQDSKQAIKQKKISLKSTIKEFRQKINSLLDNLEVDVNHYSDATDARLASSLIKEKTVPLLIPTVTASNMIENIQNLRKNFFQKRRLLEELSSSINEIDKELANTLASLNANLSPIYQFLEKSISNLLKKEENQNNEPKKIDKLESDRNEELKNIDLLEKLIKSYLDMQANIQSEESDRSVSDKYCRSFGSQPDMQEPYNWSDQLRHFDILVDANRNRIKRQSTTTEYSVCCLANIVMTENRTQDYKWSITINRISYLICLGICEIDKARFNDFEEGEWWKAGHKHYCVSSSGLLIDDDQQKNDKDTGFTFEKGDIVHFEFKKGCLRVWKEDEEEEVVQFYVERTRGRIAYSICAYLYDVGDEVQLFDY